MEATFSTSAFLVSCVFIAVRWRTKGLGDAPLWFVISSVVFINSGYMVWAIKAGAGAAPSRWHGSTVVSLGLVFFMVGVAVREMFASAGPVRFRIPRAETRYDADVPLGASINHANRRLLVAAGVTLIPAWSYFALLGYVPLFQGISAMATEGLGGAGALQSSRLGRDSYVSATARHIPMQGLLELLRNIGAPMVAAYAVSQWVRYGYSGLRFVVMVLSMLTVLLAGQRWPMAYLALACIAAISLSGGGSRLKAMRVLLPGLAAVAIALSVMQKRTSDTFHSWKASLEFAVTDVLQRVFYDQSYISIANHEYATYSAGELKGLSYVMSLLAYIPGPGESFPVEFYRKVTGVDAGWTAAPDIYTESFINFGLWGVVMMSFGWGAFVASVGRIKFSREPALQIGLQSGLLAVLAQSCYTGPVFTVGSFLIVGIILISVRTFAPLNSEQLVRRSTGSRT